MLGIAKNLVFHKDYQDIASLSKFHKLMLKIKIMLYKMNYVISKSNIFFIFILNFDFPFYFLIFYIDFIYLIIKYC